MSLRIAQVVSLWLPVPPADYGGAQRIVHLLTEELVKRGHRVTLYAAGDSHTSACLRSICPEHLYARACCGEVLDFKYYNVANLVEAIRSSGSYDVIHSHLGCLSVPFSRLSATPILHSLHSPLGVDELWVLERYARAPVAACSVNQLAQVPSERRKAAHIIHHGIDFDMYPCDPSPGRYLAFLGRMCWQKSPLDAIRIARKTGIPIVLAGEPRNADEQQYFDELIRPHLDGRSVTWAGPMTDAQKADLLTGAAALLFPIQSDEAFGLVMVEAMACGAPVVARNLGAVREVVDYGMTGFYADKVEDMPDLVERALTLDRRRVRGHAERRFTHTRMVEEYVTLYRALVESSAPRCETGRGSGE